MPQLTSPQVPISPNHPNFTWPEVACPCCQSVLVTPTFWDHMTRLQTLRRWWRGPLIITMGHVCPARFNHSAIGSAEDMNPHTDFATDISPPPPQTDEDPDWAQHAHSVEVLAAQARHVGFKSVGHLFNRVHLDMCSGTGYWKDLAEPEKEAGEDVR